MLYVWKDTGVRCNPFREYVDEAGATHKEVPAHLYEEAMEPLLPEGYDPDFYIRQELDVYPYVVYVKRSQEVIDEIVLDRAKAKARAYLLETDWYVTRLSETGKAIPDEVLTARAEARVIL